MSASLKSDVDAFENWLRSQCTVVEDDLDHKHKKMGKSAFAFLRATYFRWARQIEGLCPALRDTPRTLCVGDAHIENFGTWRDVEGRLVWGVNDFDEAAPMSYAFDLVRLATSAQLASSQALHGKAAAEAILDGYRKGLSAPRPTLLDEQETWMREHVACSDEDRAEFWTEVDEYPVANPPRSVKRGLKQRFPEGATDLRYAMRTKGSGSLGRPRYVGVAAWRGGHVVREAKAVVSSAWDWAHDNKSSPSRAAKIGAGRYRSPDPYAKVEDGFIYRRIAADARKVEFADDAGERLHLDLLCAMGFDLASVHASDPGKAAAIRADLKKRRAGWLLSATKTAAAAVEEDYRTWTNR
jgi:hypothetical protein